MTIDKAIEILQCTVDWTNLSPESDSIIADKLCIEALKRIKSNRRAIFATNMLNLPGETKE